MIKGLSVGGAGDQSRSNAEGNNRQIWESCELVDGALGDTIRAKFPGERLRSNNILDE